MRGCDQTLVLSERKVWGAERGEWGKGGLVFWNGIFGVELEEGYFLLRAGPFAACRHTDALRGLWISVDSYIGRSLINKKGKLPHVTRGE
jgi:hypothetical protein